MITKCVILARGLGTRMRAGVEALHPAQAAAAGAGMKAMIPFGRPFLDYSLSALADAGFSRACLVIGPEHGVVRDYYGRDHRPSRIEVSFATQPEPRGTADALLTVEPFTGRDEFAVMNGDNYYPADVLRLLRELDGPGTVLFEPAALVRTSNIPAERIRDFADATIDRDGFLVDLVEKPAPGAARGDRLVSMNCWRFGPGIFDACRDVPLSARGELELPGAVKLAVDRGMKLRTAISPGAVLDLSRRSDIAAVAERLRGVRVDP